MTMHNVKMNRMNLLEDEGYDPGALLDGVIKRFRLKNDAALSRALKVQAPIVSKVRNRKLPVSDAFLVRLHDITEMPISELREMMGVKKDIAPLSAH